MRGRAATAGGSGSRVESPSGRRQIRNAVAAYAREHRHYDRRHTEIFNEPEQLRLRALLTEARSHVRSDGDVALDFGCGTGNVTAKLLELGLNVVAADVSPHFLHMVQERHRVRTVRLVDIDLAELADESFDLIAAYSVLHHIHDYLATVRSLSAKLRPGGVLVLDHEAHERHWAPDEHLLAYRRAVRTTPSGAWWDPERTRWQYLMRAALSPSRHLLRLRRMWHPRYSPEGDIHVWPDDHVSWPRVMETLVDAGCEVLFRRDYLLYRDGAPMHLHERYRSCASDMAAVVARRPR